MPRRTRIGFDPPENVQVVLSRGREYFYYQVGRGTPHAGPRIRLPNDPQTPEFWSAYRQAQGLGASAPTNESLNAAIDAFLLHFQTLVAAEQKAAGTLDQYQRALRIARDKWGDLPAKGLRPVHVRRQMTAMASKTGKANNFLSAMRAFSTWARLEEYLDWSITEGISPFEQTRGHKPWTPEQISAALSGLTGMMRRGFVLYMWTGMRGSDVVRMGWSDIDEGGFAYTAKKTGRDVYCPIVPELQAEMASWEKRPGPFLYQDEGRAAGHRYTRKLFSTHFAAARASIPELAGTTLHGLRCTAVIRLRRANLSTAQISDIVGMSVPMIERYCRNQDRKASGKAALLTYENAKRTHLEKQ